MSQESTRTDVQEFLASLRAGVFENKVAAALLLILASQAAHADPWPFPESPYLYFGADIEIKNRDNDYAPLFCHEDRLDVSNMGIGQLLKRTERFEIIAQYTHHSCLTQAPDKAEYDGIGVKLKYHLW